MCFPIMLREMGRRWMGSISSYTIQADKGSVGVMCKECGTPHSQGGLLQQCGEDLPPLPGRSPHCLQDSHRPCGPPPQVIGSQKTTMEMSECIGNGQQNSEWLCLWCVHRPGTLNTPLQCRTKYCGLSTGKALWLRAC